LCKEKPFIIKYGHTDENGQVHIYNISLVALGCW